MTAYMEALWQDKKMVQRLKRSIDDVRDAVLFFNAKNMKVVRSFYNYKWVDYLYSLHQQGVVVDDTFKALTNIPRKLRYIWQIQLRYNEVATLCTTDTALSIAERIVTVLVAAEGTPGTAVCELALKCCTLEYLRKCNWRKTSIALLEHFDELQCSDVQFNTLATLVMGQPYEYVYHEGLVQIAEAHGFTLPTGSAALIQRGQKHHNCLATYCRSMPKNGSRMTRLFFTEKSTLELDCYTLDGHIGYIGIVQHKGKFNKKFDITDNIMSMLLELSGLPEVILHVEVR